MKPLIVLSTVATLLILASLGCSKKQTQTTARPALGTPTTQAAEAWAIQMEKALMAKDTNTVGAGVDLAPTVEEILQQSNLSEKTRGDFLAGVRESMLNVGKNLCDDIRPGYRVKFLRVRSTEGRLRALFRTVGDDGCNYSEFILAVKPDGNIIATDILVYLSGEKMSDKLRRMIVQLQDKSQDGRDLARGMSTAKKAMQKVKSGDAAGALADLDTLPPALRKERLVMVIEVTASAKISDAAYLAAMEKMRAMWPDDPGLDLISVDWYLQKKQPEKALAALERLDRRMGGDAYLSALRANVLCDQGEFEKAKVLANEAIKAESDLADAYWVLVTVAIRQKDHKEVARLLTVLENQLGVAMSDLHDMSDYAEFTKSPQYRTWMAGRKKSTTAPATAPARAG